MKIASETVGNVVVLRPEGPMKAEDQNTFKKVMVDLSGKGQVKVALDMSKVIFMLQIRMPRHELSMKVTKRENFDGWEPMDLYFSWISEPAHWFAQPVIAVRFPGLKDLLGVTAETKNVSGRSLLDEQGQYVLADAVSEALRTPDRDRTKLQRKLISFDERFNLFYNAISGGGVRLFHGRYSEWAESKPPDEGPGREPQSPATPPRAASSKVRPPVPATSGGGGRMSLGTLERRIEALEQEIRQIDQQLLDPAVYKDGARCRALQVERSELTARLEPLEAEWARRAEEA